MPSNAFVTLLTSESYVPGALTLANTLKQLGTKNKLVVLLDSSKISGHSLSLIHKLFDDVIQINDQLIVAPLHAVAQKLGRSELAVTYSKILLWNLDYDQIIYLDADTLPLKSLDHLFEKYLDIANTEIVASPDIGWPDIFNSGVFVVKPNREVFEKLVEHSGSSDASFDGADQGLLNEFFHLQPKKSHWTRLPFVYNVTPSTHYQYRPALTRFFEEIHLVHFIGSSKPWHVKSGEKDEFSKLWWEKFNEFFTEENDRIKLLSKLPSEGYNLKFSKLVNTWDQEPEEQQELPKFEDLEIQEPEKVFPWEHREKVEPTRVFNPVDTISEQGSQSSQSTKKVALEDRAPKTSKKTSPLNKEYDQFEGKLEFNPDKSLEEVSKMPLKMLSKKRESGEK